MKKTDSKLIIKEAFVTILPAQLLAALIPFLSGIINGLVLGNFYDTNMIAVIGYTTPVVYLLSSIRTLFSIGGGATAGNFMGQGNLNKVNETFRLCLRTLAIIGAFLMLGCLFLSHQIADMISENTTLLDATADYLKGLSFGFVPCLMIPFLSSFLQLSGSSKRVVATSILNATFNLVFDIIAVKILKAGVIGVGIATSVSQWLIASYLMIALFRTKFVKFNAKITDIRILKNVIRFGINSCMLIVMETIRNSVLVNRSEVIGGLEASSAISVLFAACGLVDFVTSGFMSATTMIGSLYAGEKNEDALKKTANWGMKAGLIGGLISGGLFFILADPIAMAFGAKQSTLELSVACLRIYAVYIMLANPLQIILRLYQCLKRVRITFFIMFMREIVFSLSAIFILGEIHGVYGVWMCFPVSAVLGSILIVIISAYKSRKQGREKLDLVWYEEKNTFADTESFYVSNKAEMTETMVGIDEFCRRNNMRKKSHIACSLLVEENLATLLEHGVNKKNLMINVFVGFDGSRTRLVFQDNSDQFDPLKRFRVYDEEHEALVKDASIKIVKKLSSDISYQFSFGMNILMIDLIQKKKENVSGGAEENNVEEDNAEE